MQLTTTELRDIIDMVDSRAVRSARYYQGIIDDLTAQNESLIIINQEIKKVVDDLSKEPTYKDIPIIQPIGKARVEQTYIDEEGNTIGNSCEMADSENKPCQW